MASKMLEIRRIFFEFNAKIAQNFQILETHKKRLGLHHYFICTSNMNKQSFFQEPMRPLSKATLRALPSQRIGQLSTPKRNFQLDHPSKCSRHYYLHSCGRSSVIWDVSTNAMGSNGALSARLEELSEPKKLHYSYAEDRASYVLSCGRSSQIQMVIHIFFHP